MEEILVASVKQKPIAAELQISINLQMYLQESTNGSSHLLKHDLCPKIFPLDWTIGLIGYGVHFPFLVLEQMISSSFALEAHTH